VDVVAVEDVVEEIVEDVGEDEGDEIKILDVAEEGLAMNLLVLVLTHLRKGKTSHHLSAKKFTDNERD